MRVARNDEDDQDDARLAKYLVVNGDNVAHNARACSQMCVSRFSRAPDISHVSRRDRDEIGRARARALDRQRLTLTFRVEGSWDTSTIDA